MRKPITRVLLILCFLGPLLYGVWAVTRKHEHPIRSEKLTVTRVYDNRVYLQSDTLSHYAVGFSKAEAHIISGIRKGDVVIATRWHVTKGIDSWTEMRDVKEGLRAIVEERVKTNKEGTTP